MNAVILTLPRLGRRKATDEQIAVAYRKAGSVWAAGDELGVSGQTVSRRLKAIGEICDASRKPFTDADRDAIRTFYTTTPDRDWDLSKLATTMGRSRQVICREAKSLGLTRKGRRSESHQQALNKSLEGKWSRAPHPKGMAGKSHTLETREVVGAASRLNWATWKTFGTGPMAAEHLEAQSKRQSLAMSKRDGSTTYTRSKGGRREDLGETYFRSSWEANYARYLNLLIKLGAITAWEYEPLTFWFDGVRRGTNSYRPDFRIHHKNDDRPEYIEIKGWVTPKPLSRRA